MVLFSFSAVFISYFEVTFKALSGQIFSITCSLKLLTEIKIPTSVHQQSKYKHYLKCTESTFQSTEMKH